MWVRVTIWLMYKHSGDIGDFKTVPTIVWITQNEFTVSLSGFAVDWLVIT